MSEQGDGPKSAAEFARDVLRELESTRMSAVALATDVMFDHANDARDFAKSLLAYPAALELATADNQPTAGELAREYAANLPTVTELAREYAANLPTVTELAREYAANLPTVTELAREYAATLPSWAQIAQDYAAQIPKPLNVPSFFDPESLRLSNAEYALVLDTVETLEPAIVGDPDAALELVGAGLDDVPDSWEALPLVASSLSDARRRELLLRLVSLVLAAYVYVNALASETQGQEGMKLVFVWLMIGWLYHGVIGAIDDAEERLE